MQIDTGPGRPSLYASIDRRGRITVTRHHDDTKDQVRLSGTEGRQLVDLIHDLLDAHDEAQRQR